MSYLDLTLRLVQIIFTLGIGIVAVVITRQQLQLGKYKLKFDLFDKKFAVFMQMRNFASAIALGQEFDPGQLYRDTSYSRGTPKHSPILMKYTAEETN